MINLVDRVKINTASQLLLLLASLAVAGCVTPWNTQLPSRFATDPRIEKQRFEQFDPFALDDLGPKTYTRQRDYDEPRNKVRRDKQAQYSKGTPATSPQPVPQPPGFSSRPGEYRQAVPF